MRIKTAVGIPIVDTVPCEAFASLLHVYVECLRSQRLDNGEVIEADVQLLSPFNMFPHSRARAKIMNDAISEGCDYLFFIDDDMILPPDAFWRLLESLKARKAVVSSGHYYRRGSPYLPVWSENKNGQWVACSVDNDDIIEIHSSGLGCAVIDLNWIRTKLADNALKLPLFWTKPDGLGPSVTDDVTFFESVRNAGGLIIGDGRVRCGHLGERIVVCDRTFPFLVKTQEDILGTHPGTPSKTT